MEQFIPAEQILFILVRRQTMLGTPFLEAVIFGTAAVKVFFQDGLTVRAQKKISHQ